MADGRSRAEWNQTASLLSLTANIHRNLKKRPKPYQPDDFNPYAPKPRPQSISVNQLTNEIMAYTDAKAAKHERRS